MRYVIVKTQSKITLDDFFLISHFKETKFEVVKSIALYVDVALQILLSNLREILS